MTKALVNVPGKEVTIITVDYPPGATDPSTESEIWERFREPGK
jgi:hypothetical protein